MKLGPLTFQCARLAWCMRSMLSASRALRISITSARVCAGRSFFVWYMWASFLSFLRLTLTWDRHDLASLERMGEAWGTRPRHAPVWHDPCGHRDVTPVRKGGPSGACAGKRFAYSAAGLHAWASCGVRMLDRQRAFSVPTLGPAR